MDFNNFGLKTEVRVSSIKIKREFNSGTKAFCSVINQTFELFGTPCIVTSHLKIAIIDTENEF